MQESRSISNLSWGQLVPARSYIRPEHLVVHIRSPVAKDLIELVPVTLAAGVGEIHFSVDDLLAVTTCGATNRPACITDDNTLTDKRLASLHTNTVGGGDK